MAFYFFCARRPLGQKAPSIIIVIKSMVIKRNPLKVPIIAKIGHRNTATTTKGIIMRSDRGIPSEDTLVNIVAILITGRPQDTIIITGRRQDTIIAITTIILIHTVTAFGFFGGATRTNVVSHKDI